MQKESAESAFKAGYGTTPDHMELLREGPSMTWEVACGDRRYVLKQYRSVLYERGKQSAEIMRYLHSRGFPVPAMISASGGQPCAVVQRDGEAQLLALFEWIDGVDPEDTLDAARFGKQTGIMHNLMENYPGGLLPLERPYFIEHFLNKLPQIGYPAEKAARFAEYGARLWSRVENLPRGFCHGDLHTGNLLRTPSKTCYVLDFDLAGLAFPAFDLAVICDRTDYFRLQPDGFDRVTRFLERFLTGYTAARAITDAERLAVYDFIAIRHFQLQAQIYDVYGFGRTPVSFLDNQWNWLRRWEEKRAQAR